MRNFRQQDEELDELSKSVERIGGVGLTIHDELVAQVSNMRERFNICRDEKHQVFFLLDVCCRRG